MRHSGTFWANLYMANLYMADLKHKVRYNPLSFLISLSLLLSNICLQPPFLFLDLKFDPVEMRLLAERKAVSELCRIER